MSEDNPVQQPFLVPQGYVLLEKAVYDLLLERAKAPTQAPATDSQGKRIRKTVYLKVLRPIHLGDIKTGLNPGEVIDWVPSFSLTVRGKEEHQLTSFLTIWNKQDPNSATYDQYYKPVFEVENPAVLEEVMQQHNLTVRRVRESQTEAQRIQSQEQIGDAATTPVNLGRNAPPMMTTPTATVSAAELPPRGSQARKDLIASRSAEALEIGAKRVAQAGANDNSPTNPNDFPITQTPAQYQVVAKVPGKPAEAEEVIELQAARAARQAPRRIRR